MPTETEPTFDVSDAARLLGIKPSALRFYDKKGLVSPHRQDSGYRSYTSEDLAHLTDVVLLRDAGVPVSTIKKLLSAPVDEAAVYLDEAEETVERTLEQVTRALSMLSWRNKAIRTYYALKANGPRIVERPRIEKLYRFAMQDKTQLQAYLRSPERTHFAVYIANARKPERFIDCSIGLQPGQDPKPVWSIDAGVGRYVEFLLQTEYFYSGTNNLGESISWMEKAGLEPGSVIAEYLTFDKPRDARTARDYYRAWIEVVE